jgi:hypothetical protein
MNVCTYVRMYVCMYVYTYVCMYLLDTTTVLMIKMEVCQHKQHLADLSGAGRARHNSAGKIIISHVNNISYVNDDFPCKQYFMLA